MRGIRLANGALAVIAVGGAVLAGQQTVQQQTATQQTVSQQETYRLEAYQHQAQGAVHLSFNQKVATFVKSLEGIPYVYGGESRGGFDCSGLTQYVYGHFGVRIARTAEGQFLQFRPISKARAWGGDLVFFHDTSNPASYVYHVGIYEGGDSMVAATETGGRVSWQSFAWAGDTVTFGTISH